MESIGSVFVLLVPLALIFGWCGWLHDMKPGKTINDLMLLRLKSRN